MSFLPQKIKFSKTAIFAVLFLVLVAGFFYFLELYNNNSAHAACGDCIENCIDPETGDEFCCAWDDNCGANVCLGVECVWDATAVINECADNLDCGLPPEDWGCKDGLCQLIVGGDGICAAGGEPDNAFCVGGLHCNAQDQCALNPAIPGSSCAVGADPCDPLGCKPSGYCCGSGECVDKKYCEGDIAVYETAECINNACEYPSGSAYNNSNPLADNPVFGINYISAAGTRTTTNCNPSGGQGLPGGQFCGTANNGQAIIQNYDECPMCRNGDCVMGSKQIVMQPCPLKSHQVIDQGCFTPQGGISCYGSHCIWDVTAPGTCTHSPPLQPACDVVTIDITCSPCCSCTSCEGVPPPPITCNSDKQCVVAGGGASCASPSDCELAYGCNNETHQCVPGGTGDSCDPANGDADCIPPTYSCNAQKQCVEWGGGAPCDPALGGAECSATPKCSNSSHQCVIGGDGIECSSNLDCKYDCDANEECVGGSGTGALIDAWDTVGLAGPSNFHLKNSNATGPADVAFNSLYSGVGFAGDWNGNGISNTGVVWQSGCSTAGCSTGNVYLKNSNTTGYPDISFIVPGNLKPIAGDFDGNGSDTVSFWATPYTNKTSFYVSNVNISRTSWSASFYFLLGKPVAGDWDGDGTDTFGVYNQTTSTFYLLNSNNHTASETVAPDASFHFKPAGSGSALLPVVGDWNNDGVDTVGLYDPNSGAFYTANLNTADPEYSTFTINNIVGYSAMLPIAGNWDGLNGAMADSTCLSDLDCQWKCEGVQCARGGSGFECSPVNSGVECVYMCGGTNGTQCIQGVLGSWFHLKNFGVITEFPYGEVSSNWIPIAGDWDGLGTGTGANADTVGFYDPAISVFYLRNSNTIGVADITFAYGTGNAGWLPIAGDWDKNGTSTVGLYDPKTSIFYLRNFNSTGYSDVIFAFGPPGFGWLPIAGDWGGDGTTGVGLYDPATSIFYLRNFLTTGYQDLAFGFGALGWLPIAGDWNNDGYDTVGLYDPATSTFYSRNSNTAGDADISFVFGTPGWLPIAGDWDGDGYATFGLYDRGQKCGLSDSGSTCDWKCDYAKRQCVIGGTGSSCDNNSDCMPRCGGNNMEECLLSGTGELCRDETDCEHRCGTTPETEQVCGQGGSGETCDIENFNLDCIWGCDTATQTCVQGGSYTCGGALDTTSCLSKCGGLEGMQCVLYDQPGYNPLGTSCNKANGDSDCQYKCVYDGSSAQCVAGSPGPGESLCAFSQGGSDCPWHCSGEQCVAGPVPTGGKSCSLLNADPDPDSAGKNLDCETRCAAESTQSASPYPPPTGHLYYDYSCQQGVTISAACPNGHADCPSGACNMVTKKCYGSKCADDSNCQYACDTVGGSGTGLHCLAGGGGEACADTDAYCSHLVCNTDTWMCELKSLSTPVTPGHSCAGSFEGGCCPGASNIAQCGGCGADCAYNGYWNPCAISNIFYADPPNTPYCSTEGAICYSGDLRGTCTDHYCDVGCVCYPWGLGGTTCGSNDTFVYPPVFYPLIKPGTELPYYLQGYATCDKCIDPPVATALSATYDCGFVYGQMANTFDWYYYTTDGYPESGFEFEVYDSGTDFNDTSTLASHRILVYKTDFTSPLDPNEQGLVYNSAQIPSTYGAAAMGCNQKIEMDNGRSCYLNFGESYYWRVRVTKLIDAVTEESKTSKWSYFAGEGVCSEPSITAYAPGAVQPNSSARLTWTAANLPNTATMNIYLCYNDPNCVGSASKTNIVPSVNVSSGYYDWSIPYNIYQTLGTDRYYIGLESGSTTDNSEGFTIAEPASMHVCHKSDTGYFMMGTTTVKLSDGTRIIKSNTDHCADGNTLIEYKCNGIGTGEGNDSYEESYHCDISCVAGACTQPGLCESYEYSDWSACDSTGHKTRTITGKTPDPCAGGISPEPLTATCTYIHLATPNGGEAWVKGTAHIIAWDSTAPIGSTDVVNVYLIDSSGSESLILSGQNIKLTGTNWSIPPTQPTGLYKIRVGGTVGGQSITDSSDSYFSIGDACTSFNYNPWGTCTCSGGVCTQTRTATGVPAGCVGTPSEPLSQTCTIECTSWIYSDWSPLICPSSPATTTQSRTIETSFPVGCTGGSSVLAQTCTAPQDIQFTYTVITAFNPAETNYIAGNWDGIDGDSVGFYGGTGASSYLLHFKNTNSAGAADNSFDYQNYVSYRNGYPIVGDWNGDGIDTIGFYDFFTGTFYLKNSDSPGPADYTFTYGPVQSGWIRPIAGDWNDDGIDTVGVWKYGAVFNDVTHRYDYTFTYYLENKRAADIVSGGGYEEVPSFTYGNMSSEPYASIVFYPVSGNWDGAGGDSIGLYDQTNHIFHLRNANTSGADSLAVTYNYGTSAKPVVGDWNNDGVDTVGLSDGPDITTTSVNLYLKGSSPVAFNYSSMLASINNTASGISDAIVKNSSAIISESKQFLGAIINSIYNLIK